MSPKRAQDTEDRPGGRAGAFVDSSAWIALFSARDGHHVEADEMFRRAVAKRTPLVTTSLVLAEVHRLLLHRAGIQPAATAIRRIEESSLVRLQFPKPEHHRAAIAWLQRLADQRITYTDAVSFAVMKAVECRIAMTFDRHFAIAGFLSWSP